MNDLPHPGQAWSVLRRPDKPAARLVLFPHSGGGPHALARLARLAPAAVEVLGLTLPGREHRFAEPPDATVAEVFAAVDAGLRPLPQLPTVLFGCSMGALLATLAADHAPELCQALVVAAQTPGSRLGWAERATGEADLLRVVEATGGIPAAVLEDSLLRAQLLGRLAADLRLGGEARARMGAVRVSAPITVFGGLADPLVPVDLLAGWGRHTWSDCRLVTVAGGHFAFLEPEHVALLTAELSRLFRAALPVSARRQR